MSLSATPPQWPSPEPQHQSIPPTHSALPWRNHGTTPLWTNISEQASSTLIYAHMHISKPDDTESIWCNKKKSWQHTNVIFWFQSPFLADPCTGVLMHLLPKGSCIPALPRVSHLLYWSLLARAGSGVVCLQLFSIGEQATDRDSTLHPVTLPPLGWQFFCTPGLIQAHISNLWNHQPLRLNGFLINFFYCINEVFLFGTV